MESGYKITQKDVFLYLKKFSGDAYDLVLADPPFTEKWAHDVMMAISMSQVIHEGSVVVIESSRHERIDDNYENLKLLDRRNFGDKDMSFFSKDSSK